ncbi:DUF1572 family protein [Falsibacillus albus]|uniref:DUF1572 domain-containing protein n=1 Tax=Falsibacillus albus TaxID=2478915 RepID=A0A3L7JZU4_9BACI|nr:DUF1572 family protein [Falsibacillus albus]RLQ96313.1 DUF1572 domain-containing protein [Falsibacillus albus]
MNTADVYLKNVEQTFMSMKKQAENTFSQLSLEELHYTPNDSCNSIAVLIKHISGNLVSRFTEFLTSDGEKDFRDRDGEFEGVYSSMDDFYANWNKGWPILFDVISKLNDADLLKTIYIRSEPHLVLEALQRQVSHYAGHIGQIVYIGKLVKGKQWKTLSIPKGKSKEYNNEMISRQQSNS